MQEREKLIEKIRKLLSVTKRRGATEAEAIQAALMAQKLMAEHDVEESELGGDDEPIVEVEAERGWIWAGRLARVIADNFRCRIFVIRKFANGNARRRTACVTFFGYKCDAEAARLVFMRLKRIGHAKATQYAKRRMSEMPELAGNGRARRALYNTFAISFVGGVKSVLERQSQALMIVCPPKVSGAFLDKYPNLRPAQVPSFLLLRDEECEEAGMRAGRDAVMSGRVGAEQTAYVLE